MATDYAKARTAPRFQLLAGCAPPIFSTRHDTQPHTRPLTRFAALDTVCMEETHQSVIPITATDCGLRYDADHTSYLPACTCRPRWGGFSFHFHMLRFEVQPSKPRHATPHAASIKPQDKV